MQLLLKTILVFFILLTMFGAAYPARVFAQGQPGIAATDVYQQNIIDIRESRFGLNNLAYLLGIGNCKPPDENGKVKCDKVDARQSILRLIQIALGFTALIAFAFVAYGGFLWATAGGSEERVGKGKKTLLWAVVGLVVILTAWSLITWIMSLISQAV